VIGESKAGSPFDTPVQQGEAVRIFTGAVVPEGSDTIIIQENTHAGDGTVEVLTGTPQGKFIRKAGLDFNEGETLLNAGDTLTPYRLALAASMNHAQVPVFKQAKVAMISTGDELVMPGEATQPGQIIASNTFGIAASIENCGAHVLDLGIAGDTRDALRAKIFEAITSDADVIVTTGGASVGDHDLVLPVAQEIGFEFEIAKIAMRPGKPFLFGRFKHKGRTFYLTGLAGNPVSSLVAFNVFVKPLIQKLSGQNTEALHRVPAVLGCDLPENDERAEYMRATLSISADGKRVASPFNKQDSSMLANLVRADCLVYRAVKAPAAKAGDACEVVLIS
jgi:molybdopterin molybdotransferase